MVRYLHIFSQILLNHLKVKTHKKDLKTNQRTVHYNLWTKIC